MLISSHLLSEVEQSVDDVVVIAKGVLRAKRPDRPRARGRRRARHARALRPMRRVWRGSCASATSPSTRPRTTCCSCTTRSREAVGEVAAEHRVVLRELVAQTRSLEEAFFELTEQRAEESA